MLRIFCKNILKKIFLYMDDYHQLKLRLLNKEWRDWDHLELMKIKLFFRKSKDQKATLIKIVEDGDLDFFKWVFSFETQIKIDHDLKNSNISLTNLVIYYQTLKEFIDISLKKMFLTKKKRFYMKMVKFLMKYIEVFPTGEVEIFGKQYCIIENRIYMMPCYSVISY